MFLYYRNDPLIIILRFTIRYLLGELVSDKSMEILLKASLIAMGNPGLSLCVLWR